MPSPVAWLMRYASRMRFPTLFLVIAILFVIDLLVPDVIPFADEALLGLFTLLVGSLKKRKSHGEQPASDAVIEVRPETNPGPDDEG